ncbi:sugar transporter, putative [Pediculus humanus corporis]|uniref:Sugar transporter, putative n=1 Tax=Pediculus humanus subsp. corporis TaxID=121224 RepID=E0VP43_PEDHC|nr:sugar transporter, putative [Pediculus humanus corporis]EEB15149.1 sugar transporter, putative [Pediculus humanus corporis]
METLIKSESDATPQNNDNDTNQREKTKNFPQYLAATAASITLMVSGTNLGWPSPVLPKLMETNATIFVTPDESTWIGSLVALGAIFGPFPAGFAADFMGRKRALLLGALLHITSWCILTVAQSVSMIYAGRLLGGISNGWGMSLLPMYVGEIATPMTRGALGVIGQIMITSGFLYVYILGSLLSFVWLNISCSLIPVIFFTFFFFMPESPYYELMKNNSKEAEKSLAKLRGKKPLEVKEELNTLQAAVDESFRETVHWTNIFKKRANRKALLLMFGLMMAQQLSGINCVLFYSEIIFAKSGSSLSPSLSTIIVGFVMFLTSFPTPYLVERLGRRTVLILSMTGMTLFLILMGGFFCMEYFSYDTSNITWIPLFSVLGYISFFSAGVGPVPWAMIGEMFASNVRSLGASLTTSFSWILAFLLTKCFGIMQEYLGDYWTFWLFSVFCCIGVGFIYFCLPETKGKTLEEIQCNVV